MSLSDRLKEQAAKPRPQWRRRPEVLLHPNIPKPMHGLAPRVILGRVWWDRVRQIAYASTDYHCAACGVHKNDAKEHQWLEGHELYDINYAKGRMTYVETVPLCHWCHNFIHDGRLRMLYETGDITLAKYESIMKHGAAILRAAKLKQPEPPKKIAPWESWRLVIDGREYEPKYKSQDNWLAVFHQPPEPDHRDDWGNTDAE